MVDRCDMKFVRGTVLGHDVDELHVAVLLDESDVETVRERPVLRIYAGPTGQMIYPPVALVFTPKEHADYMKALQQL